MIRLSVYYPNGPDAKFDFDYYLGKHAELLRTRLSAAGMENVVVEKGVGGAQPGMPAPFVCVFHAAFRDPAKFGELMGAHAADIMADVPNYTNIAPTVQLGEILTR